MTLALALAHGLTNTLYQVQEMAFIALQNGCYGEDELAVSRREVGIATTTTTTTTSRPLPTPQALSHLLGLGGRWRCRAERLPSSSTS